MAKNNKHITIVTHRMLPVLGSIVRQRFIIVFIKENIIGPIRSPLWCPNIYRRIACLLVTGDFNQSIRLRTPSMFHFTFQYPSIRNWIVNGVWLISFCSHLCQSVHQKCYPIEPYRPMTFHSRIVGNAYGHTDVDDDDDDDTWVHFCPFISIPFQSIPSHLRAFARFVSIQLKIQTESLLVMSDVRRQGITIKLRYIRIFCATREMYRNK